MSREVTTIDYKALTERIDLYAQLGVEGCDQWQNDLRAVVTMLNGMADARPVAWIAPSGPRKDGGDYRTLRQDYEASGGYGWSRETAEARGFLPLFTHPAPQPQPVLSGYGDYGAAIPGIERPCTCHPDDNPPVLCARQYALNECRAVHGEPTEAWQLLADLVAGLEATHWSSWQTTAHFDSALDAARAALAAKGEQRC